MYLNNEVISVVTDYKYLGLFINHDGYDDDDICRQITGIYAKENYLIIILNCVMMI